MNKSDRNIIITCLILLVQGAIVGTGAILPGISGGVLCVAFGIYEPMMALISHPIKSFKTLYKTFIPFLIGWVLGFVLLANAVELLFEKASTVALMLFAGLILGTVPDLMKKSVDADPKLSFTPFIVTFTGAFLLFSVLDNAIAGEIQANTGWYIFCGAVWGLSLVIPGLSSSSILIFMGLYEQMTAGIAALDFGVIAPLALGLILTLLLTARFISSLIEKKYALISKIILGFMMASAILIIPTEFNGIMQFIGAIIAFVAGFTVARLMDIARAKQEA
ncbi:MAG: DUF368 domain-containing protein [Oscillospiraceae bacterium]|nr:DUF368 domain-containing protein [Oscillospiraceae bacterium]